MRAIAKLLLLAGLAWFGWHMWNKTQADLAAEQAATGENENGFVQTGNVDESEPDPFAEPADPTDNSAEQAAVRAAIGQAPAIDPAPANPSLRPVFDQFGGEPGLVALMDELMTRLVADPRTHSLFAQVDQAEVKQHLVEQFCKILGGGCEYTGRDMRTAHAGLGIERAQLNALVEDLQLAMDARGIPFRAQNQLLAKRAPMHRQIEEK
jgi:hemoglobin